MESTPGAESQAEQARLELVFGASGYIGTNLTEHLIGLGRRVRATSRNPEVLKGRGWDDVEVCAADALDPESLDRVLAGVDTAYYLVHSMAAGHGFADIDVRAAKNFADAASRQQVRRIVYLGALTPDAPRSTHLRSRVETGDVLRAGSVPVTELRAGIIVGPGSAAWEVIRDLVNYLPVMITPRWVKSRSTPIALDNLLRYMASVAEHDEAAGEIYDAAGPDELSYLEIMRSYGALVGKRPFVIAVPVLTPRLSSYWLRLVTSVPTNVARALIDGLSQDVVATDDRIRSLIPQRLMTFEEAARAALNADRSHAVPARWVEGSIACRSFRPEYGFYAKQEGDSVTTTATADELWRTVCGFGHRGDFFYARWLWWLRRAMDWLVGGPSFRRRRRHPKEFRVGDVVDSWRVIALEEGRRLTMLMEMKAPGSGVLEYNVRDEGYERRVSVNAYFHPAGVWGLLYWYVTLPFHSFLFRGTVRAIASRAEASRD